jgi:hypothetical protein
MGGVGTSQGPRWSAKYEPNHHGDAASSDGCQQGEGAPLGSNMPKIDAATPEDVDQIIKYVRWLQKQSGIF